MHLSTNKGFRINSLAQKGGGGSLTWSIPMYKNIESISWKLTSTVKAVSVCLYKYLRTVQICQSETQKQLDANKKTHEYV